MALYRDGSSQVSGFLPVGTLRAKRRRLAPNYDRKLARRITLADGTKLVTLRDAANLFAHAVRNRQKLAVA